MGIALSMCRSRRACQTESDSIHFGQMPVRQHLPNTQSCSTLNVCPWGNRKIIKLMQTSLSASLTVADNQELRDFILTNLSAGSYKVGDGVLLCFEHVDHGAQDSLADIDRLLRSHALLQFDHHELRPHQLGQTLMVTLEDVVGCSVGQNPSRGHLHECLKSLTREHQITNCQIYIFHHAADKKEWIHMLGFFLREALVCPMVALTECVNHVSCSARRASIDARLWSLEAVHGLISSTLHMHWIDDKRWNIQKWGRTEVMGSASLFLFPNFSLMYCSRQVCMEAHSWPTFSKRVSWSFPCRKLKSIRADGRIRTPIILWLYRHDAFWAQRWFILSTRQNELLLSSACAPDY